jgi:hypothetical protein
VAVSVAASRNGAAAGFAARPQSRDVVEYGWRRNVITLGIVIATLLEIIDVTIVNVALPNIEGNFGASVDQAAWIGTGYIIANVVVIPITPWLQKRFGRRQYYAASIAIFVLASIMCGLSGSLTDLIVWRVIQGSRHLRDGRDRRADRRTDARRLHHRSVLVALRVLRQRAARHHRIPDRRVDAA